MKNKCKNQAETLNKYEEHWKISANKINKLQQKLLQKNQIIKENDRTLTYYAEKYAKEVEERGSSNMAKPDSGSEESRSTMISITELETQYLDKKHQLEKFDFYERNNAYLLEKLSK